MALSVRSHRHLSYMLVDEPAAREIVGVIDSALPVTGDGSSVSVASTSGGTSRTLASRFNDIFNVKDFGAKGDGSTDDTAAIQAAINAAAAVGVLTPDLQYYATTPLFVGGGTVYVPPGVYIVTGLVLGNRVTLQGSGLGSIIKLKANTLFPVIRNAYAADMVCIRDLRIDGNKYNQTTGVRTVTDGAMAGGAVTSSSSFILTSATANFTSNDLYQPVTVSGAGLTGALGNSNAKVFIQTVNSSSSVTLTDRPSGTNLTGKTVTIGNWPGRSVADGVATLNSYTLTSATAAFTQADVFSSLTVSGAGTSGGTLTTFVRSVESATSCTMGDFAATSVASGATITVTPRQDGILIMNRPTSPKTADRNSCEDYDGNFRIFNVLIHNCRGDGLHTAGRGDHFFTNVKAYFCDGNGFYFEQDIFAAVCNAGANGLYGFNINGSGIKLEGCKSWYSGLIGGLAVGDGFIVNGGVQTKLNGCESQDNKAHGFTLLFTSGAVLTGCTADSNGTSFVNCGPQGSGVGFNVYGSSGCVIVGSTAMDEFRNVTPQDAALLIRSNSYRNVIRITSNQNNGFYQTSPFVSANSDSSLTLGNVIEINAQRGYQLIPFSASITPDPYLGELVTVGDLTASITINNPSAINYRNNTTSAYNAKVSAGHAGCRLVFIFKQGGTGSYTATWGNAFKFPTSGAPVLNTAVGDITVVSFLYDGTSWNCIAVSK